MLKYDAVLFDLDGTITMSEPGITNCVQYALEKLGRPGLPLSERRKFIGPPLFESFVKRAGMGEDEARQALTAYRERFSDVGWRENAVYPGIPAVLRALRREGAYVAIASAKPLLFVEKVLAYFGLDGCFDCVRAVTMTDHHAEKADIVKSALPEGAKRPCMVGDRLYDVEGARAAGVAAIGVSYGYGGRRELEDAGADVVCDTVSELSDALLGYTARDRGAFLTFEGSDGCGKSTQMKRAAAYLTDRGYEVVSTREPGGCPISEKIREIVLDPANAEMTPVCEALLYAAARAQHVETVIRPALARGAYVLCDRYVDSSVAYQGAGRELGTDKIRAVNEYATGALKPDLTLLFAMPPLEALARRDAAGARDRLEMVRDDFVVRVYDAYTEIAKAESGRMRPVNAQGTPEEVEKRVSLLLADFVKARE